ncbi:MAG: hypothetical protein Q8S73_30465 [Deltaproteobacteria bacterium]|nr:hypothetical protein [Myxococcales bacterium]MDP3218468.1 hypothetical protein [Deltaproteobacteria bacterium]
MRTTVEINPKRSETQAGPDTAQEFRDDRREGAAHVAGVEGPAAGAAVPLPRWPSVDARFWLELWR